MITRLLIGFLLLLPVAADANIVDEGLAILEDLVASDGRRDPREGVATYYAAKFIGRRTSSGERYHPDKMTAAHALLPLGTLVQVRPRNGEQEVIVKVNDRCHPRHAPRNLIDLSRLAAKQIGLWGKGMIKVYITPLAGDGGAAEKLILELTQ
jgi:rare lipoprotein A